MFKTRKQADVHRTKNLALRQVLSVTKPKLFPSLKQWEQLPTVMSQGEKRVFLGSISVLILSACFLLGVYFFAHRIEIPAIGGETTEALVGTPHLINPLYAVLNDVDADIASLIYSGLLKWDPEKGFIPDLADTVEISEDGLIYTLHVQSSAKFSNGDHVQARDVIFTYAAAQDPLYRSPYSHTLRNVTIEQVDDQTVSFTLKTKDDHFSQLLTLGILPESLWSDILAQNIPLTSLNLQPIGSGPYAFSEFTKDKKGVLRTYTLKRNARYYGTEPKLEFITFKFYADAASATQALNNKNVEGLGFVPFAQRAALEANHSINLVYASIPKNVVLLFHPENDLLKNINIRKAIAEAINTQKIREEVLSSHANVLNGPLFRETPGFDATDTGIAFNPSSAADALEKAGYIKQDGNLFRSIKSEKEKKEKDTEDGSDNATETEIPHLTLTLTTVADEELLRVAEEIKNELELLGIEIIIQPVEASTFMSEVVTPQQYELLLASQYGATDPDPYYFWHSSEISKTGLNIAHYQNQDADKALDAAQSAKTTEEKVVAYRQFQTILLKDIPAVFLYQSMYAFAAPKKIRFQSPASIRIPSDRFATITDWYIKTKQVLE